MKIKKGDKVKILSGKDRGKVGNVIAFLRKYGKAVVEGVNIVKKHKRKTASEKDPGGIIEVEKPVSISKLMVICPSCLKPSRIKINLTKEGKKRMCRKCNHMF